MEIREGKVKLYFLRTKNESYLENVKTQLNEIVN